MVTRKFVRLTKLSHLDLCNNNLNLYQSIELCSLECFQNELEHLPDSIGDLKIESMRIVETE